MRQFAVFFLISSFFLASIATVAQTVVIEKSNIVEQYKGKPYYIHFVKKSETLYSLSKAYEVSIDDIKAANPAINETNLQEGITLKIPKKEPEKNDSPNQKISVQTNQDQKVESKTYLIHKVKKQETLYGIAKSYNVSQEEIIEANPGFQGLKTGMDLKVPKGNTGVVSVSVPASPDVPKPAEATHSKEGTTSYTVAQGETFYSISKKFNTTQEDLVRLNPKLKDGLKTGDVIEVPSSGTVETTTKETPRDEHPRIPKDCEDTYYNKEKTYKIALLMPLALEAADTTVFSDSRSDTRDADSYRSYEFFQFYCGAMIALRDLEAEGVKIKFYVYDAEDERDNGKIEKVLKRSEMADMDLIIGPFYAKSFELASDFAEKNDIPIVNPLSRRDKILDENRFVFKVQPPADAVATKLVSLLGEKEYSDAKSIVVVKYDKKENGELVSSFISALQGNSTLASKLKVVDYATEKYAGVAKNLSASGKNLVFFFSTNERIFPAFVSQLAAAAKSKDITLFGMPNIERQQINMENLETLSYHKVNVNFVDYSNPQTLSFVKEFREQYKTEPQIEKYAFLGYDITYFFSEALCTYGKDFLKCIPYFDKPTGFQNKFRFQQDAKNDGFFNADVRVIYLNNYEWKSR